MVSAAAPASHARREVLVKVGGSVMLQSLGRSPFDWHAAGYVFSYVSLLSIFTAYVVALQRQYRFSLHCHSGGTCFHEMTSR